MHPLGMNQNPAPFRFTRAWNILNMPSTIVGIGISHIDPLIMKPNKVAVRGSLGLRGFKVYLNLPNPICFVGSYYRP